MKKILRDLATTGVDKEHHELVLNSKEYLVMSNALDILEQFLKAYDSLNGVDKTHIEIIEGYEKVIEDNHLFFENWSEWYGNICFRC